MTFWRKLLGLPENNLSRGEIITGNGTYISAPFKGEDCYRIHVTNPTMVEVVHDIVYADNIADNWDNTGAVVIRHNMEIVKHGFYKTKDIVEAVDRNESKEPVTTPHLITDLKKLVVDKNEDVICKRCIANKKTNLATKFPFIPSSGSMMRVPLCDECYNELDKDNLVIDSM